LGELDSKYQFAIDAEAKKISLGDLDELKSLPPISNHKFKFDGAAYLACIHYFPIDLNTEYPYHSIVLKETRKLVLGHRNYLAGFSFDDSNKVLPISSDLLYSCD
jgi:hypothetical protein